MSDAAPTAEQLAAIEDENEIAEPLYELSDVLVRHIVQTAALVAEHAADFVAVTDALEHLLAARRHTNAAASSVMDWHRIVGEIGADNGGTNGT